MVARRPSSDTKSKCCELRLSLVKIEIIVTLLSDDREFYFIKHVAYVLLA